MGPEEFRGVVTDACTLVLDRVERLSGVSRGTSGQDVRYLRRIFDSQPPTGLNTGHAKAAHRRKELFAGTMNTYRHKPSHTFSGSEDKGNTLNALHSTSQLMIELDQIEKELQP